MKEARAYAPSVLLPNDTLWILGGLGKTKMLKSTELVWLDANGAWEVKAGPDLSKEVFGHCAFLLPSGKKVILAGGFDGKSDYLATSEQFDFSANAWDTRDWSGMKTGYNIFRATHSLWHMLIATYLFHYFK